jgi:DNA-binding SARP family transcriptional activator
MGPVGIRLLGPLEVDVAGHRAELRRQKQRALLALLALHAGEVVSTDRLIEEIWGGAPPKAAVGSLQNLVSELRKVLGPETLVTRPPGYVLELDRSSVDAHRFERLVADAQGPPDSRAAHLRKALALWRGAALADLVFEPFAQGESARLEEMRAAATEELFDAELELGRHGPLVAELESFVGQHPLRERPRGQLMLALYRSGRQADALEAYRRARETLVDELGIEPSPELQRLEQAILRHDRSLGVEPAGPRPAVEADRRKTVTILFADVVDSSTLAAQLDPEVLRAVMRSYFDVVRTVVQRHGGTVEKFIGDAAMAAFGIPALHEDDALRAVRAALELQRAIEALELEHGVVLRICVGVNTGEVLAADPAVGESFATGSAVVLATRLQQAALPGETLLGETTWRLVREAVATEPVEPIDLGGGRGRQAAHRALGLAEEIVGLRAGGPAPLVGRLDELTRLRAALAGVSSERKSRVITVLGEAGIGKTRLAAELASSADATVLIGRCIPYGEGATYLPLAEAIRQVVPTRVRAGVTSLLAGDEQAELVAERIAEVTGDVEGTASTGELFWAVRRFLEGLSSKQPVLLVLEDVHWAEPTLLGLIEYLAAWISEAPLLVLCLARPDLLETHPGWAEGAVTLEPLSREEAGTLVGELAEVAGDVRARVVEVAEGNALFVEQLLAYITENADQDALDALPPSIEALLASRLDRLELEERVLLERAAVVGRDFTRGAVIQLSPPEQLAGIDGLLSTLLRKGFVRADRETASVDDRYRFHHALVRDVAYAGITKELRADLHERHGTWLDQRDGAAEIVGYHLEQAHRFRTELHPGDPTLEALAERAGDRLAQAGIRAWKRADTAAAVNLLGRGASLLPARAELLCELALAQRSAGAAETAERTLEQALVTAQSEGDRRLELRARVEQAFARLYTDRRGDSSEALGLAEHAIPVFEELRDDRALGRTWRQVGTVHGSFRGWATGWQECVERAVVHYRRAGWSPSGCLQELAGALFYGPMPVEAAIERCEGLLNDATERVAEAGVEAFLGGLHGLAGRFDEARRIVGRAQTTLEELDELYVRANAAGRMIARIELLAGECVAAEHALRDMCAEFERVGDFAALSTAAAQLADALYAQDRLEEAGTWATLAETHAPQDDIISQFAWRSAQAKLKARQGESSSARALALAALAIAEPTDLLSEHGHVLLALAEVHRLGHRPADSSRRIEAAMTLFERKGDVASAGLARAAIAALAPA